MALKDLLTDLSNFKYTDYGNAGSVQSQVSGRHGTPDAPIDNSDFDNGVGFGADPNSTPQSFNVRGYQITGNKRFIVNFGGEILDNEGSIYGLSEFNTIAGIGGDGSTFYANLNPITPRGSIYRDDSGNYRVPQEFGNTNPPGTESTIVGFNGEQTTLNIPQIVLTGPFSDTYQSNLNTEPISPNAHGSDFFTSPLTNYTSQFSLENLNTSIDSGFDRAQMYIANTTEPSEIVFKQFTRGDSSLRRITLTSPNFNPFVFGDGLPYVIPQHTSTGPTQFSVGEFSDDPLIPNLHGSDFMSRPSYTSQISTETATHNVTMINLTGPTTQPYQSTINIDSVAEGAHGSDFLTTPISAFSSRFANQNQFLMNTVFDSGFSVDDFYVDSSNRGPTSFGEFKQFNKSENSLKTISLDSPNTDPDGNEFYTFPDRLPYNLDDDDQYHSRAPFIIKDIGDKWGPNTESTFDEGLVRGGILTSVSRGLADGVRLTKYIFTGKGILFGLRQAGLQLLNPRTETRIWNPLSLGSGNTTAIGVPLRLDRHLGGGNYLDAIGGPDGKDSILTGYGEAVTSTPALQGGKIVFQTARRVTLAHLSAMVPGAGGVVSIGALPEIGFDLTAGGSGNINAFSRNIVGVDKYNRTKPYTLIDGTPTLPARNPEAGYKSGIFASRYAGSPLTEMFITEEGIRQAGDDIDFPSKAITDNVLRAERFDGNLDDIDSPYFGNSNTNSNFGVDEDTNKVDVLRTVNFVNIGNPLNPIHNRLTPADKVGQLDFTQQLIYDPLSEDYPSQLRLSKEGVYIGDYHGPESDDELSPYYSGRGSFQSFPSLERTNARVIGGGEELFAQIGRSGGLPDSINYNKAYFHVFGDQNNPIVSISTGHPPTNQDRSIFRDSFFVIDTDLSPNSNEVLYYGKNTFMRGEGRRYEDEVGKDDRKPGFINLGLSSPSVRKNNINQSNQAHMVAATTGLTNAIWDPELVASGEIDPNNPPTTSIYKLGNNIHQPRQGEDRTKKGIPQRNTKPEEGAVQKPYKVGNDKKGSEGQTYEEVARNRENVEAPLSSFSLSDGEKGDPQIQITQTWIDKNRYPFDYSKPIKLQEFPLRNKDINSEGTNAGPQLQALSFLSPERGDVGNLYGLPTREKFGNLANRYQDSIQSDDFPNKLIIKQSTEDPNELILPRVVANSDDATLKVREGSDSNKKSLEIERGHKFKDNPLIQGGGEDLSSRDEAKAVGSGNKIDRYRTLAYGDIPKDDPKHPNRYDERSKVSTQENPNEPVKPLLDRNNPNDQMVKFENRDGVGFIKIYDTDVRGDLRDTFDRINMTKYGEGGEDFYGDDYVKFKFFDESNKKNIIFPATILGLSDAYTPDYSSERYIGRPDQVYVYQGTTREITFNFKVAAGSRQQLLVCWEKLNYLAGLVYPNWITQGNTTRMQAPFVSLTVGDMYNKMPGYLNSLTYNVEDDTTWDTENNFQLPKVVEVDLTFTHIGKYPLANRGVHYDAPWIRKLGRTNVGDGQTPYVPLNRQIENDDINAILGDG